MIHGTAPWRPELIASLSLLARISDALHRRGLPRPILVGGAAAEYYSASALMTGDIDITSPVQSEVEAELVRFGFTKPEGLGHTPLGWVIPTWAWASRSSHRRRWTATSITDAWC